MRRPRQFIALVTLCGAIPLAAWGIASLSFASLYPVKDTGTTTRDRGATGGAMHLLPKTTDRVVPSATVAASVADVPKSASDSTSPNLGHVLAAGAPVIETPVAEAPAVEAALPVADPQRLPEPNAKVASLVVAEAASEQDPPAHRSIKDRDETTGAIPLKFAAEEATSWDFDPAPAAASAAETPLVEAPLVDSPTPPPEKLVRLVSLFPSKAAVDGPMPSVRPLETTPECQEAETCIDDYLWSLYERTPKVDTNKVVEQVKKTVKKKGKMRTVMTKVTKYVLGDFTWKDPVAAQRVGMPLKEYVIGGMEKGFKRTLYRALRAMDAAGFMPGITSAFRDDYRQEIATGNKASSDSSFHGGSRRGGYGNGLAADIVSVKGETRMERYASSDALWKWIDANEKELKIGRPYRDRDPPHVGPITGKEFTAKRALANAKMARSQNKKVKTAALEAKKHAPMKPANPDTTKRAKPAKSLSKVSSLQSQKSAQR